MKSRTEKLDEKLEIEKSEEKEKKKQLRKKRRIKIFIFIIIFIALLLIYSSLIEPNMLMIDEHPISNIKISENFKGYKILQFGDLHYGSTINKNNINNVIEKINITKPDIVIFTGDLFEEKYQIKDEDIEVVTNALKNINATTGKYAVIGNHDFYNTNYKNIIYDGGFNLLINNYDLIYKNNKNPIIIYGTDNITYGSPNINELIKEEYNNYYKILISHEPDYVDKIKDKNIDLMLSGHSHEGQIRMPEFIIKVFLPAGSKNYFKKYYKVNNTDLFITNGIGCSVANFRFLSPPSMNLFRIV